MNQHTSINLAVLEIIDGRGRGTKSVRKVCVCIHTL